MELNERIEAIAQVAVAWREPEHGPRAEAVARTLEAPNRFTEEALTFAINQQMHLLTAEALGAWLNGRQARRAETVGVWHAGQMPMEGLQDFLAVLLMGHQYRGWVAASSPYLLPAFAEAVRAVWPDLPVTFADEGELIAEVDALIGTVDEEEMWEEIEAACAAEGVAEARQLLRGRSMGVAVLDGQESRQERENLAEDVLLHEGQGIRSVGLIWAPRGLSPDPYLDAFALFRSVFPPHESTPGALKMQQAMLEARGVPHAYGDGLEFLLSKGPPEPQWPGHVRWAEYDTLSEAIVWLDTHAAPVVTARPQVARQMPALWPLEAHGEAHRPPLGFAPDGRDVITFLNALYEL